MELCTIMLSNTTHKPTATHVHPALSKAANVDGPISSNWWNNKSLEDIPGEKWKEVPGTEGYYLISSYGRVKALSRMLINKIGIAHFYKERILQQVVLRYKNETAGDHIPELVTSASFCGKAIRIRLARMVFELFVADNTANEKPYVVLHKNGDRYDNRAVNLYAASFSEKMEHVYRNKRGHKVSDYRTEDSKRLLSLSLSKKVTQYDSNGARMAMYDSIKEAAEKTKISGSNIVAALKGRKVKKAGNCFWRYGVCCEKIDTNFYSAYILASKQKTQQPVTRFTMDGKPAKVYNSIKEAANDMGVHAKHISDAANNKLRDYHGSLWRKGIITHNIDESV
jgi:NUMOD4 motif/NUMOD1 domain